MNQPRAHIMDRFLTVPRSSEGGFNRPSHISTPPPKGTQTIIPKVQETVWTNLELPDIDKILFFLKVKLSPKHLLLHENAIVIEFPYLQPDGKFAGVPINARLKEYISKLFPQLKISLVPAYEDAFNLQITIPISGELPLMLDNNERQNIINQSLRSLARSNG